ncbi:CtsR family transcriptional regulator [Streptococcus iniae]|uniref:CtsR family transcriptional regulator n=1 Tax=Streptococcus iniae TaxID=1346 RepID=UPI0008D95886|nr:CtsR family transcriptional regulator [Streptococcus iniae]OHX28229.1 CtsR family transcriptional regulator [Streptococcus iniae]RLV26921.1 CtsR family transcriptional regulator [Streptococcus iniae]
MSQKNTSDSIEEYIKELLAQSGIAEIKRSLLADSFQVVPSQINYVIKTRFTESKGYEVESKRGGGGYIRIAKVQFSDKHHLIGSLRATTQGGICQQEFTDALRILCDEGLISDREGNLILAMASDSVLGLEASHIRSRMLCRLLQRIDRKES